MRSCSGELVGAKKAQQITSEDVMAGTQTLWGNFPQAYSHVGLIHSAARLSRMATNVLVFALGCGVAALLFVKFGDWCFVVPPVLAMISLSLRLAESQQPVS